MSRQPARISRAVPWQSWPVPSAASIAVAADLEAVSHLRSTFTTPVRESSTCRGGEFALRTRPRRAEARQPSPLGHHADGPADDAAVSRESPLVEHRPAGLSEAHGMDGPHKRPGRGEPRLRGVGITAIDNALSIARRASSLTSGPAQTTCVPACRACLVLRRPVSASHGAILRVLQHRVAGGRRPDSQESEPAFKEPARFLSGCFLPQNSDITSATVLGT